jgi:hypothetical protein
VSAEYLRFGSVENAPGGSAGMHLVAAPAVGTLLRMLCECCTINGA